MQRVLITGPSGFIGSRILQQPVRNDLELVAWSTRENKRLPQGDFSAIVHCAGLAHQMTPVPADSYFEINHRKTLELAREALDRGIPHFVFLSTTKVFGDARPDEVFDETSECKPTDPYGESKWLAEKDLLALAGPAFTVSIVRPPLVFGPGVKGNFSRLIKLLDSPWPMPFGNANSRRSMVFVDNLIALIFALLNDPKSGVFHAGEERAPTVNELAVELRRSLGRPTRMVPVPKSIVALLRLGAPSLVSRLFDGFVIENKWTCETLGFRPPIRFDAGIRTTVEWYAKSSSNREVKH